MYLLNRTFNRLFAAVLSVCLISSAANAQVQLRSGDKLTVTVVGHDSLHSEVTIGPRGEINLPLLGEIIANGKTLSELRSEIVSGYSGAVYRVGTGASDVVRSIDAIAVLVEVAEYRPIYVFGDVRSPGVLDYRPGLMLLQAVASVGGPGQSLEGSPDAGITSLRIQTEAATLERQIELDRQEIERLNEDLRNLIQATSPVAGLAQADQEGVESLDADDSWAIARQRARALRDAQSAETFARLENRRNSLEVQEANAMNVVSLYAESVANLEADARLRPIDEQSLLDLRQAVLLANARALEIGAELSRVELEISRSETTNAVTDQVEITRVLNLISEKEAAIQLATTELRGLQMQIEFFGTRAITGNDLEYTLFRQGPEDTWIEETVDPRTTLNPGDVVEVRIVSSALSGALAEENSGSATSIGSN